MLVGTYVIALFKSTSHLLSTPELLFSQVMFRVHFMEWLVRLISRDRESSYLAESLDMK